MNKTHDTGRWIAEMILKGIVTVNQTLEEFDGKRLVKFTIHGIGDIARIEGDREMRNVTPKTQAIESDIPELSIKAQLSIGSSDTDDGIYQVKSGKW